MSKAHRQHVALPERTFLYTLDQIATLISLEEGTIKNTLIYYEGRSTGAVPRDKMRAINIMSAGEKPQWRVSDRDFRRWMRFKGFRYYERGYFE